MDVIGLKLRGHELDLVNIWKDSDGNDSPLEDALRRDLTINALFYNINEAKIEDMTGQGISDLRAGFLRSPIDPVINYTREPKGAIRAFRFSDKFNF